MTITLTKDQICDKCLEGSELIDCPMNDKDQEACERRNKDLYCHECGSINLVNEGPAEGYWCSDCGSSDQDE